MADTNLRFRLSSVFTGEGFTAANQAVRTTAGTAQQAQGAITRVSNAFGQLDGIAGTAVRTFGGVIQGFRTLGIIGGTVVLAQAAISMAVEKTKKKYEQMAAAAKDASERILAYGKRLAGEALKDLRTALDDVGKKADADARSLDNVAAAANRVNLAMGRQASASEAANVVELKLENLNKVISAENDNAAALAKVEGDLAVAVLERTNAMADHTRAVDAAKTAEKNANDRVQRAQDNITAATEALAKARETASYLEGAAANDHEHYGAEYDAALKGVTEAENLLRKRQDELVTATAAAQEAHINVETESIKLKSAESEYTIRVNEAEKAITDLKDAQAESARREAISAEIRSNVAAAEKTRDEAEERRAELKQEYQARRDDAMMRLAAAELRSQQWEDEKVEQNKKHYSEIQRRNLDNLVKIYDHNKVMLTEQQRKNVESYKEWLEHQTANPENVIIESIQAELKQLDEEEKMSLDMVENNTKSTVEELQKQNKLLQEALTLH